MANVTSDTTVNIGGLSNGNAYSDSGCNSFVGSRTISSGNSTATFYYKNNSAETVTLRAMDNAGSLSEGTLGVTVGSSPTKLVMTGSATISTGSCNLYTVTSKDNTDAAANVTSTTTVNIGGLSNGNAYSDSGCNSSVGSRTISSGSSSTTFYYKNGQAQTVTLRAMDNAGVLTEGDLSVTVQ